MLTSSENWAFRALSLAVAAAILLATAPPARAAGRRFSGEEIFRGVFFGTGPVAARLPEIWQQPRFASVNHLRAEPRVRRLQERLVAKLEQAHPGLLDWFGIEAQSGDHLRIRHALGFVGDQLVEAIGTEANYDAEFTTSQDLETAGLVLGPVVAVAAFVFFYFAVEVYSAVHRVIGVTEYVVAKLTPSSSAESTLQQDVWVSLIAARLQ
jgi:SdpC family antimicrobial peptide